MNSLELNNVSVGYQSALIDDINLKVPNGKLIALLGSNGSGKSTFIKTMLRIIEPLKGDLLYNDKTANQYSAKEWSQIFAAVFSGLPYTPMIQVRELIEIGSNHSDLALISSVIKQLDIELLLDKYANEISDGQLQKVMIARALIQNTPYVIFDEPTAHLDFRNKKEVFLLLKNLVATTEKTFIIITHEVLQALALADEIWYIDNKRLYHGTADEIEDKFGLKEEVLKINQDVRN